MEVARRQCLHRTRSKSAQTRPRLRLFITAIFIPTDRSFADSLALPISIRLMTKAIRPFARSSRRRRLSWLQHRSSGDVLYRQASPMNPILNIKTLKGAKADINEAIAVLEKLREQHQKHPGTILSASVESLIKQREALLHAITQMEKLARPAGAVVGQGLQLASPGGRPGKGKPSHSRRGGLNYR
jgi:hypothetical protein